MAILFQATGSTTSLLPTTSWAAPNALFSTTDRNDSSAYTWTSSTSTVTLPSSGLADGYLFLWGYEFEDTSNGRHMPQGRMQQASGTGTFVTATTGGYNRDNSEDRSYVSGWSFVDGPSASSTYQFEWKRDTDTPTGGTVRSFIQAVPLYYADIGLYTSTSTTATGGTTPVQIGSFTGTDGTNITISSSQVSVTGDNKRYLCLGSAFHEGPANAGTRTQRWYGFEIDGTFDDSAKTCCYYRNGGNDENGGQFIKLIETDTATRTIEVNQYRGDGVSAGQGGADVDGVTSVFTSAHSMVIIELNDSAEVFASVDSVGGQEFALTGPVDVDIASTGDIEFNDSASFTRSTDTGVNIEQDMDVFAFANISHARESGAIGSGSRWTVHGEFTVNGTEQTGVGFHGNYNRGNQSSADTHGSSTNQAAFFAVTTGQDIGVSNQELSGTEGGGGDIETQAGWVGFGLINLDTLEASSDTNVSAGVDTLTLTEQQATIALNVDVATNLDTLTLTEYQSTITLDTNVSTNVDALTLTEFQASITQDVNVSTNVDALSLTENAGTITFDVDVSTNLDTLTVTTYQSDVSLGVNVSTNVDTLSLTEYQASIGYDVNVLAGVNSLTLTENQTSITSDINVDALTASLSVSTYQVGVTYDVEVTAGTDALTLSENTSTITYDVDVQAGIDNLVLTTHQATLDESTNISAGVDNLTLTELQASIVYDVNVLAGVDSLTLTSFQASLTEDTVVDTNLATLTLTEYLASIGYDVNVTTSLDALSLTEYQATVTNPATGGGRRFRALVVG